jgi:apolipoprotein N-acyltransferase
MIVPIPYVQCGIGLLLALLSIPLILRKIPLNRVYGIRIRKSLASQHNWYEINAYGGKLLFVLGLFLLAFGWVSRDLAPEPTSAWAPVFLIVPLLAFVPVFVLINAFARRLPES